MPLDIHCPECGSNNLRLNGAEADDSVIACGECGHVLGTLETLKDEVSDFVIGQMRR